MKEQKKKRIIAALLFVSCIVSGFMLFASSDGTSERLQSLAQADSLIEYELTSFSIDEQQISRSSVEVDSSFTRKIYHVDLPPGFSQTQLHAVLNRRLRPFGISTPARVTFPERDMQIHLKYEGTIVRTIALHTDSDLVYSRDRASIIVTLDSPPDDDLLHILTSFGEPIPIVLPVEHPMQANELQKSLSGRYGRFLFWLQNSDHEDLIQTNPTVALRRINQFEDVLPNAKLLLLDSGNQSGDSRHNEVAAQTSMTFINAQNALRLHETLGKASFLDELDKLKSNQSYPLAIITGNETTLNWLGEKLPDLKRAGVELIPPPQTNF